MNNWCICWFFTHIFTALRLYMSFGVKGLTEPRSSGVSIRYYYFFSVALQPSAGYGLLWLCSPALAMASCGSAAQRWLWPPGSRGSLITHNDAPQSVGLLWMSVLIYVGRRNILQFRQFPHTLKFGQHRAVFLHSIMGFYDTDIKFGRG
jgi:hypothetical protein